MVTCWLLLQLLLDIILHDVTLGGLNRSNVIKSQFGDLPRFGRGAWKLLSGVRELHSETLRRLTGARCAERAGNDVHSPYVRRKQRRYAAPWRCLGCLLFGVTLHLVITAKGRGRFDAERVKADTGRVVLPRLSQGKVCKRFILDESVMVPVVSVAGCAYGSVTGIVAV